MSYKLQVVITNQFKKDIALLKRRGKDIGKLNRVLDMLIEQQVLPSQYRNHKLKGEFRDRYECHIEPDWLLIYRKESNILKLERTGNHSDLFSK